MMNFEARDFFKIDQNNRAWIHAQFFSIFGYVFFSFFIAMRTIYIFFNFLELNFNPATYDPAKISPEKNKKLRNGDGDMIEAGFYYTWKVYNDKNTSAFCLLHSRRKKFIL